MRIKGWPCICPLSHISQELLFRIFSFLPTATLLRKVSIVSAFFRDVIKTPSCHRYVDIKLGDYNKEKRTKLKNFVENTIKSSLIFGVSENRTHDSVLRINSNDLFFMIVLHGPSTTLIMNDIPMSRNIFEKMELRWMKLKRIRVELGNGWFNKKSFYEFFRRLASSANLQHIDFVKVGSVNIEEIVEFACGSAPLKSIEPTYNLCEQVGKLKSH